MKFFSAILIIFVFSSASEATVRYYEGHLFNSSVYWQLRKYGSVDSKFLGRPGENVKVNKQELAVEVLQRFEQARLNAGIKTKDVSKAIMEGRFNLSSKDLRLAHESLVPEGSLTVDNIHPVYLDEKGNLPDEIDLFATYFNYRDSAWNERFGSMEDFSKINTIVAGQDRVLTKMDLGLRVFQRFSVNYFKKEFGIERDAYKNYADTVKAIKKAHHNRPEYAENLVKNLDHSINHTLKRNSVPNIMVMGTLKPSPFNLSADATSLRQKYLRKLNKKQKKSISIPKEYHTPSNDAKITHQNGGLPLINKKQEFKISNPDHSDANTDLPNITVEIYAKNEEPAFNTDNPEDFDELFKGRSDTPRPKRELTNNPDLVPIIPSPVNTPIKDEAGNFWCCGFLILIGLAIYQMNKK